jgi:predicted amidophosphoribosyltransferase
MTPEERVVAVREAQRRYCARHPGRHAAAVRKNYRKRKDAGLCGRCGKNPPLTEAVCWDCLNEMEEAKSCRI